MTDLHTSSEALVAGAPAAAARAGVVLIHGRGASADSMLDFERALDVDAVAYRAAEADGRIWYPESFLAPLDRNEPYLSAALARIDAEVNALLASGLPEQKICLLGFSQGACLSLEYAARTGRHLGAVLALSGGLIGSAQLGLGRDDADKAFEYDANLASTKFFLGCSDVDAHIPLSRVQLSGKVLEALGADVDVRIYPGMGHTVNADEVQAIRDILGKICEEAQ
ncbi:MAG: putative esterase [Rhodothermales bacterium]|jgi:predicted esterase